MPYSPVQHRPETHHRKTHTDRAPERSGLPEALQLFWRSQMYRLTIIGSDGSLLQHTVRTEIVWIRPPRPAPVEARIAM